MAHFAKSLERSVRKALNKWLESGKNPIELSPESQLNPIPKKILLLRHDRIGDLLVTTPFLSDLRAAGIKADILLSTKNYPARKGIRHLVCQTILLPKKPIEIFKLISKLKKENYDLVIDLLDNVSTTSNLILKFLSPEFSLGFDKPNRNVYSHIVPLPDKKSNHIVERILSIGQVLNIQRITNSLSYKVESRKRMKENFKIGINLSGSTPGKFWGKENFEEFLKIILRKKYFSGDSEFKFQIELYGIGIYRGIAQELAAGEQIAYSTDNSFHDYALSLSQSDLIISPDTAAVHLTAAWKIPQIVLMPWKDTPNTGMPWSPWNSPHKLLLCNKLSDIKPEELADAFSEILESEFSIKTGEKK